MKKNDIFTFTAPNGIEVTAVVVAILQVSDETFDGVLQINEICLCYAQNRLFTYEWHDSSYEVGYEEYAHSFGESYGEVLVDYAILPDYDEWLARYNDLQVAQAETQSGI